MTSIQSSFTELSLLPSSLTLSEYGVGNPETSLVEYELANQESDTRSAKPNIAMPTTPLAVWVIRRIGLAALVAKTEAELLCPEKSNVRRAIRAGLNVETVAAVTNWTTKTVQTVVAGALKDGESAMDNAKADAMAQRVAAIVAGLLAPHFFKK